MSHNIVVVSSSPAIAVAGGGGIGPPGADGADGVDGGFETHDFTGTPATTHQITHALGYRPNVTVTVAGVTVIAEVEYVNDTRIDIRTSTATEPIIYLS